LRKSSKSLRGRCPPRPRHLGTLFQVQEELDLPGLLQDCQEFLIERGITKFSNYSKIQWKTFVKAEISKLIKANILQKMMGYKKISYDKTLK
jgi:hypothetical protein